MAEDTPLGALAVVETCVVEDAAHAKMGGPIGNAVPASEGFWAGAVY